MTDADSGPLRRETTRRAVLGGALAASSVAAAYAIAGDPLAIFSRSGADSVGFDETIAFRQESVRISHLLRRVGFGLTRDEYDHYQSIGLEATLAEVLDYASVDDTPALEAARQIVVEPGTFANLQTWWLVRIVNTRRPLQEKMTLFWHGLLTSQTSVVRDPEAMQRQNEFFRGNALDSFDNILRGVWRDPAMMVYLDISGSVRRSPNENFARELMELFALGEGNFSEGDVREAARAFTGWLVPRTVVRPGVFTLGEPQFRPLQFDNGVKTVLGKSGPFQPDDVIDVILERPESARFIVHKLFEFFVYPGPTEAELKPFVDVYLASGRSIGAVVEGMLRSDAFFSPKAYRAIVKSPVEYVVGLIKALGVQAIAPQLFAQARTIGLATMGQTLFEPPNVAGWPGGATWLNSATLFARINLVNLLTGPNLPGQARQQQRPAVQPAGQQELGTARQAAGYFLPFLLDDNIPEGARQVLLEYAGGPDEALTPEQLRGLAYLVLASPQFHLS